MFSFLRATSMTSAPCSANPILMALPMPCAHAPAVGLLLVKQAVKHNSVVLQNKAVGCGLGQGLRVATFGEVAAPYCTQHTTQL
jgi:hypothetical protein